MPILSGVAGVCSNLISTVQNFFSPSPSPGKRKRSDRVDDGERRKSLRMTEAPVVVEQHVQCSTQTEELPAQHWEPQRAPEPPLVTPAPASISEPSPSYKHPARTPGTVPYGQSFGGRGYVAGSRAVGNNLSTYRDGYCEAPPLAATPVYVNMTPAQGGLGFGGSRRYPGAGFAAAGLPQPQQAMVLLSVEDYTRLVEEKNGPDYFQRTPGPRMARTAAETPFNTTNGGLQASFDRAAAAPSPSRSPGTAAAAGTSAAGAAAAASPPPAAARTPEPRAAEAVDRVTLLNDKARADLQERLWAQERAAQEVARLGEIAARPPSKVDKIVARQQLVIEEISRLKVSREKRQQEMAEAEAPAAAEEDSALRPLTAEQEALCQRAFNGGLPTEKLVERDFKAFGFIEITRKIMDCMRLGQWLNDEVINFYLGLLQEREIAAGRVLPDKRVQPRVHFHNTFFYNKLFADSQKYGYKNVQRWTSEKKLGYSILDCDLVLVPVHQEIHWVLAVIDIKGKKVEYLDSLHGGDRTCLEMLAQYITDEAQHKRGQVLDTTAWPRSFPRDATPRQLNGCDCGVFTVKFADYLARGRPLDFTQENMPYFRQRIVAEIIQALSPY